LGSKSVEKTVDFARQTVDLPGPLKRVIAICADSVMMPLALWAAMSLKAGSPAFSFADWPAYVAEKRKKMAINIVNIRRSKKK